MEADRLRRLVAELEEIEYEDIDHALPHVAELMDALGDVIESFGFTYGLDSTEGKMLGRAASHLKLFVDHIRNADLDRRMKDGR
jgi:hypothetical protein